MMKEAREIKDKMIDAKEEAQAEWMIERWKLLSLWKNAAMAEIKSQALFCRYKIASIKRRIYPTKKHKPS
jgi:hypothetical protein